MNPLLNFAKRTRQSWGGSSLRRQKLGCGQAFRRPLPSQSSPSFALGALSFKCRVRGRHTTHFRTGHNLLVSSQSMPSTHDAEGLRADILGSPHVDSSRSARCSRCTEGASDYYLQARKHVSIPGTNCRKGQGVIVVRYQ